MREDDVDCSPLLRKHDSKLPDALLEIVQGPLATQIEFQGCVLNTLQPVFQVSKSPGPQSLLLTYVPRTIVLVSNIAWLRGPHMCRAEQTHVRRDWSLNLEKVQQVTAAGMTTQSC